MNRLWVIGPSRAFVVFFLIVSGLFSSVVSARTITLACVDCYSSSSFYALRAEELAPPGVQVKWVFIQTHDYDPAYQNHIKAFPESKTIFKRVDPDSAEQVRQLVSFLKSQNVEGILGGMDQGTYHASAFNQLMGFVDDAVETRDLRRMKRAMGRAAGEYGIPDHTLTNVDDAMEFVRQLDQQEIVVKYNAGAAGFKMDFLSKADMGALRQRLQERLDTNLKGAFGKKDDLLIQPRLVGREFFINTYSLNGRTYVTGLSEYFRIVWGDKSLYFVNTFLSLDSEEARALTPIATEINRRLGKFNGPAHIEFLLENGTRRWYLLENNVRVAGAGVPELERAVYGTSQLDLHLLKYLDPKRLERELASLPRKRSQGAAMFIVPSPYDGELTEQGVARIESLPSFFKLPFNYRIKPGKVEKTHDLYSAPFVIHMLGSRDQIRADVAQAIEMLQANQLVQFKLPLGEGCEQAVGRAGQLFGTLRAGIHDVDWSAVP